MNGDDAVRTRPSLFGENDSWTAKPASAVPAGTVSGLRVRSKQARGLIYMGNKGE